MSDSENPNPIIAPRRKNTGPKKAFNADAGNAFVEVQNLIREHYTYDLFDGVTTQIAKILTTPDPQLLDPDTSAPIRVRARCKDTHDHLPIPRGPAGWDSIAARANKCKLELHPEYVSQNKQQFANLAEGSEVRVSHIVKKTPYEYNNGELKSNYTRGVGNIAGLKPSEQFRVCSQFLSPSGVSPPEGAAQAGSQSPEKKATFVGMDLAQTKDQCNTIYKVGDYKTVEEFGQISFSSAGQLKLAAMEAFIPTLLKGFDVGMDSIGFGTTMSSPHKRKRLAELISERPNQSLFNAGDIKAKPKPHGNWRTPDNNYTTITQQEAMHLMASDTLPLLKTIKRELSPEKKINQNQIDALVFFGYNLGPGHMITIIKAINRGESKSMIYNRFQRYVFAKNEQGVRQRLAGLVKRRKTEAEWFFGNKKG